MNNQQAKKEITSIENRETPKRKARPSFERNMRGTFCDPCSVVAWLYAKKQPELAEEFNAIYYRVNGELEKAWEEMMNKKK